MAHPYYEEKVLPFVEQHPVVNKLVKTPFIGTGFELKELAKNLRADEDLRYITACKSGEARVLVCVTNLRLHILDKGLILNKYQLTVNLPQISSVKRGRGIFFGTVIISVTGFEDDITLTDFWGKDTENFQRILQDAITDYGLGRINLTQPWYQQPQQMGGYPYQQPYPPQGAGFQQAPLSQQMRTNNPAYNYGAEEPYTEAKLRAQGLDPYGHPLQSSFEDPNSRGSYSRSNRGGYRSERPMREVSPMSTEDKFNAINSGGFATAEQLRKAKADLEHAYQSGWISEDLYQLKRRKYDQGLL